LALGTALLCRPALAQDQKQPTKPEAAKAPGAPKIATVELYANLMPFVEYVRAAGPTPANFAESPDHIGIAVANYNGVAPAPRVRMLSGTSHFGVRGSLALVEQLRIVGQIETAIPLDGDPNPWESDIPNRNSFLGLTGDWGTLAFGRLDTPYKWSTLTTVNPIKGGYVADYTPVIGTPGFLATAINSVPRWVAGNAVSNTAFDRREANSIQYWSPILWGFYARFSYTTNEHRPNDDAESVRSNPYIVSMAAGFDFQGLRLRYAWENHHDYFGLGYIYNLLSGAPDPETRTANDYGNKGVAQYTLSITPHVKTRVAGIFEYLKYTAEATIPGDINRYERPAFYALVEQTLWKHHVWGAYGRAYSGKCGRVGGASCSTAHVGAQWVMGGYMFQFTENVQAYLMGYRLINERSALYVTTPALQREGLSPGVDTTGMGLGFYYAFGADLLQ
jgi:hypothetical protein